MRIEAAILTHPGGRPHNEDAILCRTLFSGDEQKAPITVSFNVESSCFFAIADGMGGYGNGDFASKYVLEFLLAAKPETSDDWLHQTELAHRAITAHASLNPALGPCGTTFGALALGENELLVVNIGDSMIYRRDGAYLSLVSTNDRSDRCDEGSISPAESCNTLRQAIGGPPGRALPIAHVRSIPVVSGRFLLCTDGVTDTLTMDAIENSVCCANPPIDAADSLYSKLIVQGSKDNFSFIIIDILSDKI